MLLAYLNVNCSEYNSASVVGMISEKIRKTTIKRVPATELQNVEEDIL